MNVINGDLTAETKGLIIHGVNCQGAMGSGVALAIKNRWPEVYDAYKSHPQGKSQLGQVQFVSISDGLYVANCWTQEFYGGDGKIYADKASVRIALFKAFSFCDEYGLELKTPKIASGLAGLDWDKDVRPLFEQIATVFPDVKVTLFVYEP